MDGNLASCVEKPKGAWIKVAFKIAYRQTRIGQVSVGQLVHPRVLDMHLVARHWANIARLVRGEEHSITGA